MVEYYRKRASGYDEIYETEAWRPELAALRDWLLTQATGKRILELAAGTGYWTEIASRAAEAITATDINAGTLAVASGRNLGERVVLLQGNAWRLPSLGRFDCGMAHLWWSHVRTQDRTRFLSRFASYLEDRATLLMIDQNHVPGFCVPITRWDNDGNSYQNRWLENGERFEVIKNHPTPAELERSLAPACDDVRILHMTHFWAVSARLRPAA